eukprot:1161036-Pelagomonas_calceolata.AAC.2
MPAAALVVLAASACLLHSKMLLAITVHKNHTCIVFAIIKKRAAAASPNHTPAASGHTSCLI